MSVLIRGMKKPNNCTECRFCVDGWCYVLRPESEEERQRITTNYCPLIEVPPHGRLIDADTVYKRLQKQAMSVWGDGNPRYQIVLDVIDAIRFAPTVIEAEEGES